MSEDADQVRADFDDAVNMAPKELEDWLETDRSKEVGWGEASQSATAPGGASWRSSAPTRMTSATPRP
jgi:hypothetical protein